MARPVGFLEVKQRVVYSLFRAAARVGVRLRLPLDQMETLLRMAYFEEARARSGLDLGAIAAVFGKSLRTVSSLHHQYRGDFFAPEHEVALRRAIAAAVDERAHTADELVARFADRPAPDVLAAIDDLVRERKIVRHDERLARNPEDHDFFDEADIVARVDGLNRQMDIVAETVWQRLLADAASRDAVARSYVFHARDGDYAALHEAVLDTLRRRAIAADDAAKAEGGGRRFGLTLAAAPLPEEDR